MAIESDRLLISLEARVRDFEKNFSRATRTSDRDFGKIENRAKKAADRIEQEFTSLSGKTMGIGKNMALGLVAGFTAGGLTAIMSQIGNVTRGMAQIGDEARRAGLSTTAFQELRYVAEQNRVGVDALVDGFKELSLRTAEFVTTGGGSAADAFTRLGYTSEDLAVKMADPSALFTEIIGKLGQMDKASAILNADEIFGGAGGEQFVQLIEQGEAALNRTRQEAHDLGLVMSDELIAKADELDRRFNMVANTVGSALKAAIVGAAAALMDFINTFNSMPGMINLQAMTAPLATRGLGVMQDQRASKQAALDGVIEREGKGELSGWFNTGLGHDDAKASLSTEIAELTAAITRRQDPTQFDVNSIFDGLKTPTFESVGAMQTALAPPKPLSILVDGAGTLPTPGGGGGGGGGGRASSMREEKDATAALIAELQRELTLIGMSEAEKRVDAELRKAGASATDNQKTSIRGLVAEIEAETAAMDQLEAASDSAKGMAGNFLKGLVGDLRAGKSGTEALASAFGKLADQLIDMAIDALVNNLFAGLMGGASGAGGGLLGGIFGFSKGGEVQAFANGGHVRGTGTGRSDSIPAALSNGEYVVNSAATAKNRALLEAINAGKLGKFADGGLVGNAARSIGSSGSGAGVTIAPVISVKVEGGSRGQPADQEMGDNVAKQIEQTMRGIVADEMRRASRPGNFGNTRSR